MDTGLEDPVAANKAHCDKLADEGYKCSWVEEENFCQASPYPCTEESALCFPESECSDDNALPVLEICDTGYCLGVDAVDAGAPCRSYIETCRANPDAFGCDLLPADCAARCSGCGEDVLYEHHAAVTEACLLYTSDAADE